MDEMISNLSGGGGGGGVGGVGSREKTKEMIWCDGGKTIEISWW